MPRIPLPEQGDHFVWLLDNQITEWGEAFKAIREYIASPSDETLDACMRRIKQLARNQDTVNRDRLEASCRALEQQAYPVWAQLLDLVTNAEDAELIEWVLQLAPRRLHNFGVIEHRDGEWVITGGDIERVLVAAVLGTYKGHDPQHERFFVPLGQVHPMDVIVLPSKARVSANA